MKEPALLQKEAAEELQEVLEEYPFSGLVHALYVKALKNQGNYLYPKQLKRTAIAVPDRKILHHWTEQPIAEPEVEELKPAINFAVEEPKVEMPEPVVETPIEKEKPKQETKTEQVVEKPKPQPVSKPEPIKPTPTPKPKVAVQKDPTKETDLDLANLPASVRETVLRARKLRQKFGQEEDPVTTPGPIPPVVVNKPKQKEPIAEDPEILKPSPESPMVAEPEESSAISQEVTESTNDEDEVGVEPIVEPENKPELEEHIQEEVVTSDQPDFELVPNEPIEEKEQTPITHSDSERHSFLDWLETPQEEPIIKETGSEELVEEPMAEISFELDDELIDSETEDHSEEKASTERMQELYASFMDKPKIDFRAPSKEPEITAASLGTSGQSDYITETLAQVYVNQKLYNRAINAYEILSLKYPEKSSFFAAQILDIKELLNEKDR